MNTSVFSWEVMPSYEDLGQALLNYIWIEIRRTMETSLKEYWGSVKDNFPGVKEMCIIVTMPLVMALLRALLTETYFKPLGVKYKLSASNQVKMLECCWRLLFYSISWTMIFYLAVVKHPHFQIPSIVFMGWPKTPPSGDFSCLYALEFSFYVHAVYCVLFIDVWKKDSAVMTIHHIVTIFLLAVSYLGRVLESGTLFLLFHDICDVLLELCKLLTYFKHQGNKKIHIIDTLANFCFVVFVLVWTVSRLYFFPLKHTYYTLVVIQEKLAKRIPILNFCAPMELVILAMNVYWSLIIFDMLYRIVTGKMPELEDTRDLDAKSGKSLSRKHK